MSAGPPRQTLDERAVERACALGVRDALLRHRLHGVLVPVWRDGKVVHVDADDS